MNRPKKKKESSLLHELKELELLGEGEFVDIPELENEDLIEENSRSIIVRCLNPTVHKVGGLVKALPPIWGLEDSVTGRGVDENKVQFFFHHERDLQFVLSRGPWFVNGWIVSMEKWSPNPGPEFLCKIPFWIRVRGIPVHLLKKEAVEGLLGPLGKVEKVELHAKNSSSVEYIRALVWISTEEPLQFRRIARFKSGEIVPTELEYEKLIKVCFTCRRLTHDQLYCPMQSELAAGPSDLMRRENQRTRSDNVTGPSKQKKDVTGSRRETLTRMRDGGGAQRTQTVRRSLDPPRRRDVERKDKKVMGEASKVWLPRRTQSLTAKAVGGSRSTEESTAIPKSRSPSLSTPGMGTSSGASQDATSVFNRLGTHQEVSPHLRHVSTKQKGEIKATSSVFERLRGYDKSPSKLNEEGEVEPSGNKRRRLSRSDERSSKKAKVGDLQGEMTPSVFERLGSNEKGSGSRSSGEKNHSASVAANASNRSAQRMVLESGKIVEEGLMFDSNPSIQK